MKHIIYNDNCNIYAFSDLHGDFSALISCLKYCAKVISTPDNIYDLINEDLTLDTLNTIDDLIKNFNCYDCKWIGGNSIVITGDIIDNSRKNTARDINDINESMEKIMMT
jgi:hypothetical protein